MNAALFLLALVNVGFSLFALRLIRQYLRRLADSRVRDALSELVAVKDIKEYAAALHFAGPSGPLGEGWEAEWKRLQREYVERQPKAWAAARAALQSTNAAGMNSPPGGAR